MMIPNSEPCQILCIEHDHHYLYSEMIQVAFVRRLYWIRPVALKIAPPDVQQQGNTSRKFGALYDLRQGPDLLLPSQLLRAALDTEVIPLLAELGECQASLENDRSMHYHLHEFVRQIWQAYPNAFPT